MKMMQIFVPPLRIVMNAAVMTVLLIATFLFFAAVVLRRSEHGPSMGVVGWVIRNVLDRREWVWVIILTRDRFLKGKWAYPAEHDLLQVGDKVYLRDEAWTYLKKNRWGGVSPCSVYKEDRPVGCIVDEFSHSRISSGEAATAIQRAYQKKAFEVHLSAWHNPVFIVAFVGLLVSVGIFVMLIRMFFLKS